jgi:hypothetical protein
MKKHFKTPLVLRKVVGDENGIAIISVSGRRKLRFNPSFTECVMQIEAYFEGKEIILVSK